MNRDDDEAAWEASVRIHIDLQPDRMVIPFLSEDTFRDRVTRLRHDEEAPCEIAAG